MPRPALRSRSLRKIRRRLPGGVRIIHYLRRRPGKAKCAACRKPLAGVPRKRPLGMKKTAKTRKRPERAYGGYLCPRCLKERIKEGIR